MKKIISILTLILCGIFAMAQESKLQRILTLTLPAGNQKLTYSSLPDEVKTRKNSTLVRTQSFEGLTYKFGNVLFQINADTGKVPKDHVEKFKSAMDGLNNDIDNQKYTSEMKNINNNKVAILKKLRDKFSVYQFMAENEARNKLVVGTLEFTKNDEHKADAILDYILNNLKFK